MTQDEVKTLLPGNFVILSVDKLVRSINGWVSLKRGTEWQVHAWHELTSSSGTMCYIDISPLDSVVHKTLFGNGPFLKPCYMTVLDSEVELPAPRTVISGALSFISFFTPGSAGLGEVAVHKESGAKDLGDYPHLCPKCHGPAYIGFDKIDCSRGCE